MEKHTTLNHFTTFWEIHHNISNNINNLFEILIINIHGSCVYNGLCPFKTGLYNINN
jgi:hypothetical protein